MFDVATPPEVECEQSNGGRTHSSYRSGRDNPKYRLPMLCLLSDELLAALRTWNDMEQNPWPDRKPQWRRLMISKISVTSGAKVRDDASDPTPNGSPTWATIWILYFLVPRNLEQKSVVVIITWKIMEIEVINLQADQSHTTSKLTSKTNQNEP